MAFLVPALVPLGVSLAKISRNASEDGQQEIVPTRQRGRAIIDRMVRGGINAPITQWSEDKLERTIKRNSVFAEYADELRLARVNALSQKLEAKQYEAKTHKIAQAPAAVVPEDPPDVLFDADLLLAATEPKTVVNPARDAALELLADNSFDALLITDAKGVIAYSNKAFTTLTGYEQAEVIGKSPKLLQGPGTDRKVLERLKESMKQGLGDYEGSAINYRKDGTPFIMHWRVVPVKVAGEIKAWVAIQREGSQIPGVDMSH